MITLLGQGLLYDVHRNKVAMLTKMEKRKAFVLVCFLTICISIITYIWIVYA